MATLLGTVTGQLKVDVSQAVAAYAAARSANSQTVSALSSASSTIGHVSDMFLGVGAAIAGALGYAADQAAQFNQEMDYFQAVSGATTSQMDQIRAKAIQLDQTTMFSTEDIATMFTQLAKSGESTSDILGGVADACTNLAQAAQIPLTDATNDIVTALSAFNLTASDAAMVANDFTGATTHSILTANDLASALKYVGGVADGMGVSIGDTTDALTLLGKAGISGSMGGTELRQMLVSLAAPTAGATKEMQSLGIITADGTNQMFQANGQAKSLGQVFQILQTSMEGLTAQQQAAALKVLFNNRAMAGAEILTKAGAAGFDQMNQAISGTSAADIAAKRMDNLQGSTKILTSSLKTMAITAGQPLQNFLNNVVKAITAVVQGFSHLSSGTQSAIIYTLAIVASLALFIGTIGKAISIGLSLWKTIGQIGEALKFLSGIGGAVINMVRALTVAMLENPVVLITVAVIALAVAFYELYQHCETFRDAINDVGRAFKEGFEATVDWFKKVPQYFEDAWNAIKHAFDDGVNWVKQHWMMILGFILDPLGTLGVMLWKKFGGAIEGFFSRMYDSAVTGLEHFGEAFVTELGKLPNQMAYALGFAIGRLIKWGLDLTQDGISIGKDVVMAVVNWFIRLPGYIVTMGSDAIHAWESWNEHVLNDAMQWGEDVWNAIVSFFENLPGYIEQLGKDIVNDWEGFQNRVLSDALQWGKDVLNGIVNFFEQLPGNVRNIWDNMVGDVENWGSTMFHDVETIATNIWNGLMTTLEGLPGDVEGIFDNALHAIESMISDAFNAAASWASSLWDGFKHGLGIHSPSFIEKQMTQISACMNTETQNINRYVKQIQGLGSQLQGSNPAQLAQNYSALTMQNMMGIQSQQLQQLQVQGAVSVPGFSTLSSQAYGSGAGGQPTKVLEVNVFNPTSEDSASSTAKQLQTLAQLGAF